MSPSPVRYSASPLNILTLSVSAKLAASLRIAITPMIADVSKVRFGKLNVCNALTASTSKLSLNTLSGIAFCEA